MPWEVIRGGGEAGAAAPRAGGRLRSVSGGWRQKSRRKDLALGAQGRGKAIKRPGCKAPGIALTTEKRLEE